MTESNRVEEKALKVSMIGASILAVWGIAMAAVSDSGIILLDGMFNLISGIMAFFSIEITRLVAGKPTRDFPLGYFALESLFVLIKGTSVLILILMALYSNIKVLISGGREPALGIMTIYVVFAVLGAVLVYLVTNRGFKKTGSEILEAETKAWLVNAVISGAIGVAFGVTMLIQQTQFGWIDRYIDQVLVILFSIFFIKDPLVLMKNGLKELLLSSPQTGIVQPFQDKIFPLKKELGARELRLEIMKTGRRMWVTAFIDPVADTININELMRLKQRLGEVAREVYQNTDTEVILKRG